MTTEEMRELDAWIAEHVFGYIKQNVNYPEAHWNELSLPDLDGNYISEGWVQGWEFRDVNIPFYSTQASAAMGVLKKCAENLIRGITINQNEGKWIIQAQNNYIGNLEMSETLELAICLFAKQLFSQPTTK